MTVYRVAQQGTQVTIRSEYRPFQGMRYRLLEANDHSLLAEADSEQSVIEYLTKKNYII